MALKTENLAILLTDIVGYTETTAQQSRQENELLLDTHNQILFPIIKRFKGRLVKSIGDALLVVYRSPTDAMLCSMAMQDALYEYNRDVPTPKQIHIRIAASLGEVRITKNDIFGEPVNTTSRIEGVTPTDEIYFSEAIYMAMNKAEVPCKEVGWKELKGISEPIRLFNIPRFSTPRLVPEDVMSSSDISDLVYPYGGAHLSSQGTTQDSAHFYGFMKQSSAKNMAVTALLLVVPVAAALVYYVVAKQNGDQDPLPVVKVAPPVVPKHVEVKSEPAPAPVPQPVPVVRSSPVPKPPVRQVQKKTVIRTAPVRPVKQYSQPAPVVVRKPGIISRPPEKLTQKDRVKLSANDLVYISFNQAKADLRKKIITEEEYNEFVDELKKQINLEMKILKTKLKNKEINKKTYKREYANIRNKYK